MDLVLAWRGGGGGYAGKGTRLSPRRLQEAQRELRPLPILITTQRGGGILSEKRERGGIPVLVGGRGPGRLLAWRWKKKGTPIPACPTPGGGGGRTCFKGERVLRDLREKKVYPRVLPNEKKKGCLCPVKSIGGEKRIIGEGERVVDFRSLTVKKTCHFLGEVVDL